MFVDLEIIFNNTYGYIQFTYEVPINLRTKIDIGDIVTVPFRNVERQAIVLKVHNENINVPNIKSLFKKVGNIDQFQLKYLEQIAISNNTNIGMLLHKHIEYSKISNQKKIRTGSSGVYGNKKLSTKLKKNNNVIFTSSLLEAKKVAETLKKEGKYVDFYQKTGGVKEFTNLWQNLKSFQNIIILSVNFEKIIIKDNLNFHFFNCNNFSYNLPNLNNINIVESSIIKHKIFKGHFFYYSEFPSLELFNKVNDYFLEIPDVSIDNIYGNNLMECVELFDRKYNNEPLHIYTANKDINLISKKHKLTNNINSDKIEAAIMFNPTISYNGILSSNRLIHLIKNLDFFTSKNIKIINFSTKKINPLNQLSVKNLTKWAIKENIERSKYGPNINIKIFKVFSEKEIDISKFSNYLIGPKKTNNHFEYELKIQINRKYNYNVIMSIFSILKNSQLERVRTL